MADMEFEDGDVVIFENANGMREVAIRRGYPFAQWVVATWGFRGLTDDEVRVLVAAGGTILHTILSEFAARG